LEEDVVDGLEERLLLSCRQMEALPHPLVQVGPRFGLSPGLDNLSRPHGWAYLFKGCAVMNGSLRVFIRLRQQEDVADCVKGCQTSGCGWE
jgi:hypothetical protein